MTASASQSPMLSMVSYSAEASMTSSPTRRKSDEAKGRECFERNAILRGAIALGIMAVMAAAGYFVLERAIAVGQTTATAVELSVQQELRSQRIASLSAQYALGNHRLRAELRAELDSFERTHRALVANNSEGPALEAAAIAYLAQIQRTVATSPRDPSLAARTSSVLIAERPLLDALAATSRARRQRTVHEFAVLRDVGGTACVLVLTALLLSALTVFRPMAEAIAALEKNVAELTRVTTTDPLTGMLNKRSFQARGTIEVQKARRYQRPLSLLVIGADQLPAIEATFGPDGGKSVLQALTSSFCDATRISDLIARVDDEQFAILLPETSSQGAELLAERLRKKVGDLKVSIDDKPVACTISIGVAAAEKDATLLWSTFKRADEALYEAKMRGRNRVFVAA
jgi:diguanylate cyclase (GGDEF)-like protein